MMPKLTIKQSKALRYIVDYYKKHKYPPLFLELEDGLQISGSTARYIVWKLQGLGYVDCLRYRGRVRGILPLWSE